MEIVFIFLISHDRTISLSNCIKNIFTNDKDPVRKNLENNAWFKKYGDTFYN